VITRASEPNGTNGPLMPEIHEFAPHSVYVARKGEVNAWDNEDFVKTVRATGRKTLIIGGVWTSVCVMFPALDAKVAGYKVYAVMDASGDISEMANRTTLARFVQGGVIPTTNNAVLWEVHRTWNRPEVAEIGNICTCLAKLRGGGRELRQGSRGGEAVQVGCDHSRHSDDWVLARRHPGRSRWKCEDRERRVFRFRNEKAAQCPPVPLFIRGFGRGVARERHTWISIGCRAIARA